MAKPKTQEELDKYREALTKMNVSKAIIDKVMASLPIADDLEEKLLDLLDQEAAKHTESYPDPNNIPFDTLSIMADGYIVALLRVAASSAIASGMSPFTYINSVVSVYSQKYISMTGKGVFEDMPEGTIEQILGKSRVDTFDDIVSTSTPLTTKKNDKPN